MQPNNNHNNNNNKNHSNNNNNNNNSINNQNKTSNTSNLLKCSEIDILVIGYLKSRGYHSTINALNKESNTNFNV